MLNAKINVAAAIIIITIFQVYLYFQNYGLRILRINQLNVFPIEILYKPGSFMFQKTEHLDALKLELNPEFKDPVSSLNKGKLSSGMYSPKIY